MNLVAADLPGYTVEKRTAAGGHNSFDQKSACAAFKPSPRQRVARRDSPDFAHANPSALGTDQTFSTVAVETSPAVAARFLAQVRRASFRRCVALALARSLKNDRAKGGTFRPPVVTAVPVSAPGTDGTFAIHVSVRLMFLGLPFRLYIHFLGFQLGPSVVTLSTLSNQRVLTPFPAAEEQRLFTLLVGRAIAHRL